MRRASRETPKTPEAIPSIRPNEGITAWYQRQLDHRIVKMHKSLLHWLSVEFRRLGIEQGYAQDAIPSIALRRELRKLTGTWQGVFDKMAGWMSEQFAERVVHFSDGTLDKRLRTKGFSVRFVQTDEMKDAYGAVVGEQVSLIKSIAAEHLQEVEGLVMRSVARGRDLGYLTHELQERYGITRRRAAFIARDQNNKATSTMQAARQKQLGISKGIWKHSHAGKVPRPSHVKADGKEFSLDKGMFLDGKWVMPGEEPNCRCTWKAIIPGLNS